MEALRAKSRIRARDRRDNEISPRPQAGLLVQRFHRHKFITTPGPKHMPVMSSSSPNAVAVDLICSAFAAMATPPTHLSRLTKQSTIPGNQRHQCNTEDRKPSAANGVSSLFFDNCPRPTIPPNKAKTAKVRPVYAVRSSAPPAPPSPAITARADIIQFVNQVEGGKSGSNSPAAAAKPRKR